MRGLLKVLLTAIALQLIAGIPRASAQAASRNKCDEEAQMKSFSQEEPKSWTELYRLFKDFGACDAAGTSNRFSADVGRLFVNQWEQLEALNRLTIANKAFEQFVLRHLDTTIDENDLLVIADTSKTHCPAGQRRLCSLVHTKAQSTLDKLRDESE
jgi:hypothetical protein